MAWYRSGSITVTNGSTTVTGSGTQWIANAGVGEALYAPDGRLYEITNIASDTSITIAPAYLGSTASAQAYTFVPSQSYIRDLAAQAADLVNNYSTIANTVGQGKFGDGTLAAPGIRFSDDLDTGFFRSGSNEVTFVAGGVAQFKYNTSGLQLTATGSFVNLTTTGNTTLGDAAADTVTINGTPTINAPTVITTNSTTNALRITQTGTGNALLVEDSASPDSTPTVIDAEGRVIVGSQTPITTRGNIQAFQVAGVAYAQSSGSISRFNSGSAGGGGLEFNRSRSGTLGTNTVVNSGDGIADIYFNGADGTAFITAAQITASVDGTPGTNSMPGRLVLSTTASGASTPTERMRIDSAGQVGIGVATTAGISVRSAKAATGAATTFGFTQQGTVQSDSTTAHNAFLSSPPTQATSFTLANLRYFYSSQGAFGAGSSVTNQFGFHAESTLIGATNNYGFYSNIAAGTGRWNFYANGTAANYFAGNTAVGNSADASAGALSVFQSLLPVPISPSAGQKATIYLANNGGTPADGAISAAIGFSGISTTRRRALIAAYQDGAGGNQFGLQFYTRTSSITANDDLNTTPALTLTHGNGVVISRTAVTAPAATDGNVFSGLYTPTLTNTTNVAASTAYQCNYMRVGNVVTVSGQIDIDPTATGRIVLLVTLPIASGFVAARNCAGTFAAAGVTTNSGGSVVADVTNGVAAFDGVVGDDTNKGYYFTFTYRVI